MKIKKMFAILMITTILFTCPMISSTVQASDGNSGISLCGLTYNLYSYYTGNSSNASFSHTFSNLNGAQLLMQITVSGSYKMKVVITGNGGQLIHSEVVEPGKLRSINILNSENSVLNSSTSVKVEFFPQSIFTINQYVSGYILY